MDNKFSLACRRLNRFICIFLIGIAVTIFFTACGALQPQYPLHGVLAKNVGKTPIKKILIVYGINKLSYVTPTGPGGSSNYYGDNPIPDSFLTTWETADGKEHRATVQLKGKLNYVEELRAIELWFADEKLEVYQATKSGARGELTNRRRIYPD
jgi:hypothetical protein